MFQVYILVSYWVPAAAAPPDLASAKRRSAKCRTATYFTADGEMGFPGNLAVTVRYTLNNNELRIDYSAVTDKDTVVNLPNTTRFSLAGACHGTVLD